MALLVALGAMVACRAPGNSSVKIAVVAPFQGTDFLDGYRVLFAVRLAVREWNAQGGVAGRPIELIALDDRGSAREGALQAKAVTLDPQVIGVIGHPGSASARAAAPIYHEAHLPAFLLGAAEQPFSSAPPFFLHPDTQQLAEGLARAATLLSAERLALVSGERTSPDAMQELRERLEAQGATLALHSVLPEEPERLRALVEQLEQGAGLVVVAAQPADAARFARAVQEGSGHIALFLLPEATGAAFLPLSAGAGDGVYYLAQALAPQGAGPAGQAFHRAFRALSLAAAQNIEPGPWGALAYDATNFLLAQAQGALTGSESVDRERLVLRLREGQPWQGVTGTWQFDERGQRRLRALYVYRISGLGYPGELVEELSLSGR